MLDPTTESQQINDRFFEQYAGDSRKPASSSTRTIATGSLQIEAVEAAEGALNLVLVPRYKGLHGVVSGGERVLVDS